MSIFKISVKKRESTKLDCRTSYLVDALFFDRTHDRVKLSE